MNKRGIESFKGFTPKTILFCTEGALSIGVVVDNTGLSAGSDGKKILKAGTPIEGDLTNRTTAMKQAATKTNTIGILMDDVDVTDGKANAAVFVAGIIDLNKVDPTIAAMIDADVKAALPAVRFVK